MKRSLIPGGVGGGSFADENASRLEVVQFEGWLMKRGEGYEEVDEVEKAVSPVHRTSVTESGGVAGLYGAARFDKLLSGKSEKKRYFRLVSIEERVPVDGLIASSSTRSLDPSGPAKRTTRIVGSELRYYPRQEEGASLKGCVVLTHECELVSKPDETNFKLVTPGRSYYLRPEGDPKSTAARTTSNQWVDVVRRELRVLWKIEKDGALMNLGGHASLESAMGSPLMGKSARTLRSESNLGEILAGAAGIEELPSTLEAVLSEPNIRVKLRTFMENALAVENLDFYEALEQLDGLTGPALAKHVSFVVSEFVKPGANREVNLSSSQRTKLTSMFQASPGKMTPEHFVEAKVEILKLIDDNFFTRFHQDATERTGAFPALYGSFGLDGFDAALAHFGPVKTDLERVLQDVRAVIARANAQIAVLDKELSSSSRDVAVPAQKASASALRATYSVSEARLSFLTSFAEEIAAEVLQPLEALQTKIVHDLDSILKKFETPLGFLRETKRLIDSAARDVERLQAAAPGPGLEEAKKSLAKCRAGLVAAEALQEKPMIQACASLESLELYRLQKQAKMLRHMLAAEKHLLKSLAAASKRAADACSDLAVERELDALVASMDEELMASTAAA